MWGFLETELFKRRLKLFQKKYPDELIAMLVNLAKYQAGLNLGTKPMQLKDSFIRREPQGVHAIDQRGTGKKLRPTRLYVFPSLLDQVLHLITIGDKDSQKDDIATCKDYVKKLRR